MTHTTQSTPGIRTPLRVTRNTAAYQNWWSTLTDIADIVEAIDELHTPHTSDVESSCTG